MASVTSVTDRVRPLDIGVPVAAAYFFGDTAVFVDKADANWPGLRDAPIRPH